MEEKQTSMKKRNLFKYAVLAFTIVVIAVSLISDGLSSRGGYHYNNRIAVLEYQHIDPKTSDRLMTGTSHFTAMRIPS